MVIAFEGLMRVGKSTTIAALRARHPDVRVVEEVTLSEPAPPPQRAAAYYRRNDLRKSRLAARARRDHVVLMDRFFLSTALFRLAEREELAPDWEIARLEIARLFPRIQSPDVWILIREAPRASWRRARRDCGERLSGGWRDLRFVERLAAWYDVVFQSLVCGADGCAAYVIPSGPLEATLARVERILAERITTPAWRALPMEPAPAVALA